MISLEIQLVNVDNYFYMGFKIFFGRGKVFQYVVLEYLGISFEKVNLELYKNIRFYRKIKMDYGFI